MRLCNRNLAEPLLKMIPESARELPEPFAHGASLSPRPSLRTLRSDLCSLSVKSFAVANSGFLPQFLCASCVRSLDVLQQHSDRSQLPNRKLL